MSDTKATGQTQARDKNTALDPKTLKTLVESHKLEAAMQHSMGPEDRDNNISLDSIRDEIAKESSENFTQGLQKAYELVADLSDQTSELASKYGSMVSSYARAQSEMISKRVHDRPMMYLAAGAFMGFVIGRLTKTRPAPKSASFWSL